MDLAGVRSRMHPAPAPRERERRRALRLLCRGLTASGTAQALGRDAHTIGRWAAAFGEGGPLTLETSACLRTGFDGIDLRSAMLAGMEGDEEAAVADRMAAFIMTMSCLSEEEWQAIAPTMGIDPGEWESFLCVTEELGGPEGMAQALSREDESGLMAFFAASADCGLQMDGGAGGDGNTSRN